MLWSLAVDEFFHRFTDLDVREGYVISYGVLDGKMMLDKGPVDRTVWLSNNPA